MADHRELEQQRRATSTVIGWGLSFGILLAMVVIVAALWLAPQAGQKSNISDQPNAPAASGRSTTGEAPTGGNSGTSGNAASQGSGAPGSGTGSPTGSSTNVTGSNPAGGGASSGTSSGTR